MAAGQFRFELNAARKYLDLLKAKLRPIIVKQLQAEMRARAQYSEAELRETIRVAELTIKQLDEELDKHTVETTQAGEWSLEVETLKGDLLQAKTIDQKLTAEIEQLQAELKADSHLEIYRWAEPDSGRSTPKAATASPARVPNAPKTEDTEKTER